MKNFDNYFFFTNFNLNKILDICADTKSIYFSKYLKKTYTLYFRVFLTKGGNNMNINLQSVGFKADSKLEGFIDKKLQKLQKLNETITGYNIYLNLEKSDINENKLVEIKVLIPKGELFASKKCKSFEESVDLVVDALKTQILKQKDKIKE